MLNQRHMFVLSYIFTLGVKSLQNISHANHFLQYTVAIDDVNAMNMVSQNSLYNSFESRIRS